jgi:hypothetical protein
MKLIEYKMTTATSNGWVNIGPPNEEEEED